MLGIYADIGMSGEFDATDTDGDGLYDIFETTGMRMQNGYLGVDYEAVTTDKYNPDTDGDGLLDGEEIDPAIKWSEKRYYSAEIGEFVVDREYFFTMYSDPNNPDTDGDGLLDGRAQYYNGQMVVPADKYPRNVNGIPSVWKQYICDMMSENIPSTLCEFYECDVNGDSLKELSENINFDDLDVNDYDSVYDFFKNIIKSSLFTEIGSKFLMFRLDDGGTVLHSQTNKDIYDYVMQKASEELNALEYSVFESAVDKLNINSLFETWQKPFGYDNLFDEVFRLGTNDNMDSEKITFEDSQGDDFVLWIWRGDYLNLGAGAEMGLYKKNKFLEKVDIEHWDSVDFEIPMKLSLYNYSNDNVDTVFNWNPINDQWWITGFNPECMEVDVKEQVLVGTVDMSYDVEMYNSIVSTVTSEGNNNKYKEVVYYDDTTHMIWIMWGEFNE